MKHAFYRLILSCILSTGLLLSPTFADLYNASKACVRVSTSHGVGSGVVVGADSDFYYALTNAHVADANSVTVEFFDAAKIVKFPATVVLRSQKLDIAVLKIATSGKYNPALLPLDPSYTIKKGDVLATMGHPQGKYPTTYFCSYIDRSDAFGHRFTPPPMQGRSGSPLLAPDGSRVVGIVYGYTTSDHVGLAIPADVIARYVDGAVTGKKVEETWTPKGDGIRRLATGDGTFLSREVEKNTGDKNVPTPEFLSHEVEKDTGDRNVPTPEFLSHEVEKDTGDRNVPTPEIHIYTTRAPRPRLVPPPRRDARPLLSPANQEGRRGFFKLRRGEMKPPQNTETEPELTEAVIRTQYSYPFQYTPNCPTGKCPILDKKETGDITGAHPPIQILKPKEKKLGDGTFLSREKDTGDKNVPTPETGDETFLSRELKTETRDRNVPSPRNVPTPEERDTLLFTRRAVALEARVKELEETVIALKKEHAEETRKTLPDAVENGIRGGLVGVAENVTVNASADLQRVANASAVALANASESCGIAADAFQGTMIKTSETLINVDGTLQNVADFFAFLKKAVIALICLVAGWVFSCIVEILIRGKKDTSNS